MVKLKNAARWKGERNLRISQGRKIFKRAVVRLVSAFEISRLKGSRSEDNSCAGWQYVKEKWETC